MKPKLWLLGRWILWLCVGFVLLRGLVTFLPAHGAAAGAAPAPPPVAPATGDDQRTSAFAALFAQEYLTFAPEAAATRTTRLQPFLAPGLDPAAGVNVRTAQKPQTVLQAWPWSVEQTGLGQRTVTVVASVQERQDEKGAPAPARFVALAVPVALGQGGGLAVNAYPVFVPVPLGRPDGSPGDGLPGQPVAEPDPQVRDLLTGFLKAYAGGSPAEIRYFLLPGADVRGLDGQFLYRDLAAFQLRQAGAETWAVAQVVLADPVTHVEFRQQLLLEVARQERWYVKAMQPIGGASQ